ncbi:tRNA-dihydrouridine synthase [Ordospora colligata]|uniref:tRNA-dihydrouridine synthase n=1 Tax=Ordospora colligata OC4 TaxID=1354746 RepID=A0A0B2UJ63_9MICR|nr:tRNA-dihydrouridine synthase [Ordospora colligata OC4]KHN69378.1 tRNA-dihydrouridine synthase [Ordospora colligata OC4]TBU14892.1 tRNA-dihydrouridine synthase [Ordospora colligata]TBU15023.1 tRNA-dihydrouridine synthase [Ordospora colligata]TBU18277.1 tRNA-dihydrouridine synthase [Ordospora colligata]
MNEDIEISLAPMMDVTTPQFRRLIRLTSKSTVLFTEMIVCSTVVHVTCEKLLEMVGKYDANTVVQIGGSDASEIVEAVKILQSLGYKEFNLNCGCPSARVKKGCFGAILMLKKQLVAEIVNKVHCDTGVVLSLKIRTGVDDHDGVEFLDDFITYLKMNTACRSFYVHARKCWLSGLSPKQNRQVPPLDYESVYAIKQLHPDLKIMLNGCIDADGLEKLCSLDGLMIGRESMKNIFVFWEIDRKIGKERFGEGEEGCSNDNVRANTGFDSDCKENKLIDDNEKKVMVHEVIRRYFEWYGKEKEMRIWDIQPMMNLLVGKKGCKAYRQMLGEIVRRRENAEKAYKRIMNFLNMSDGCGRVKEPLYIDGAGD